MAAPRSTAYVYRFGCSCGRYWYAWEFGPLKCRRCQRTVYRDPGRHQVVVDQEHLREEFHAPHTGPANPVKAEASAKISVEFGEKPVRPGLMAKWFIAMLVVTVLNGFLDSGVVAFLLLVSYLSWTWSMLGVVVQTSTHGPKEDSLLPELTTLLEEWKGWKTVRHEGRDAKPNHILQGYLDGEYDVDEFDTRMGASAGVKRDEERLRLLRQLEES